LKAAILDSIAPTRKKKVEAFHIFNALNAVCKEDDTANRKNSQISGMDRRITPEKYCSHLSSMHGRSDGTSMSCQEVSDMSWRRQI
jgi:peroxiredoxin family protein